MTAENVYFQYEVGECGEYMESLTAKKIRVTVIISPLKITSNENVTKINSGCNMFKSCHNPNCMFSLESHPKRFEV
jgi:5,10-methylenetetrahydrofolate reductase